MGRRIILSLIVLLPLTSNATYDLEYNMTTYHYFESCPVANSFVNKFADCGKAIYNPILAIKNRHNNVRGLLGLNSVGSIMFGGTTNFQDTSFIYGAYFQDISEFNRRHITPVTIYKNNNIGLTPIIGYEKSIRISEYKLFTIITPILATIGIGYAF